MTLVRDKDLAVSRGGALGPRNREDDLLCRVMLAIGICRSEIPVITLAGITGLLFLDSRAPVSDDIEEEDQIGAAAARR